MRVFSILCIFLVFVLQPQRGNAQLAKGSKLVNLGFYSGYGYPVALTNLPNSYLPVVGLSGDYFLSSTVSLGVYGAYTYSFFKYSASDPHYKDVWKGWDVGLRSSLHAGTIFKTGNSFDPYLSVSAGFSSKQLKYDENNIYASQLNYRKSNLLAGVQLGCRYLITNHFGVYLEAGKMRSFFFGGGLSLKW